MRSGRLGEQRGAGANVRSETRRPALNWHVGRVREASVRLVEGVRRK